jgi:hypothetical protein
MARRWLGLLRQVQCRAASLRSPGLPGRVCGGQAPPQAVTASTQAAGTARLPRPRRSDPPDLDSVGTRNLRPEPCPPALTVACRGRIGDIQADGLKDLGRDRARWRPVGAAAGLSGGA